MNDMATMEEINDLYMRLIGNTANPQIQDYLNSAMVAEKPPQVASPPAGLLGGETSQRMVPPEIANAFMQSLLYQTQLPAASKVANPLAMNAVNIPALPALQRINVGATALPTWLAEAAAKKD